MTCSIYFSVSVILVPCEDTHANCGANPGWPASWCGDSRYPYVDTNCPVLCNQCSKLIVSLSGVCRLLYFRPQVYLQVSVCKHDNSKNK